MSRSGIRNHGRGNLTQKLQDQLDKMRASTSKMNGTIDRLERENNVLKTQRDLCIVALAQMHELVEEFLECPSQREQMRKIFADLRAELGQGEILG